MTGGTVHVWTVDLDLPPDSVCELLNALSGEERVRAARYRTTETRLRFIAAHGALRRILARYVDMPADRLCFENAVSGKPCIKGSPLPFNLSHSDGLAVCAVAALGQVGVDVERIRPVTDADALVKRHFAPGEARHLASLPPPDRDPAFFSTWTRKEAFLKATAEGLQRPLDSFEVEVAPSVSEPRLVISHPAPGDTAFCLRSFRPRPDYIAAVALDHEIETLELFDWHVA